jgi:hypothetical protein
MTRPIPRWAGVSARTVREVVMRGRRKSGRTLGEHGIFGDEEAAKLRADLTELRDLLANLTERVHAQFTTISAHAEIARQQFDFAREEAHAELERTREMLIDLVERTRAELSTDAAVHLAGAAPGASVVAQAQRVSDLEARFDTAAKDLDRCFQRQGILADTMEALIDSVLSEQRGEPVARLTLV